MRIRWTLSDAIVLTIGGVLLLSTLVSCLNEVGLTQAPTPAPTLVQTPTPDPTGTWTPKQVVYGYDTGSHSLTCPDADGRALFDVNVDGALDYVCIWSCATYDVPPFPSGLVPGPDHVWVVAYGWPFEAPAFFWGLGHGGVNHCFPFYENNYWAHGTRLP